MSQELLGPFGKALAMVCWSALLASYSFDSSSGLSAIRRVAAFLTSVLICLLITSPLRLSCFLFSRGGGLKIGLFLLHD